MISNYYVKICSKNKGTLIFVTAFVLVVILVLGIGAISDANERKKANLPYGDDVIIMHYFHWTECPHCAKQNVYNKKLEEQFPNLKIQEYEIRQPGFQAKYQEVANQINGLDPDQFPGTPTTVIGDQYNTGYNTDADSGARILQMVQAEQDRINLIWDDSTMIRTQALRAQLN